MELEGRERAGDCEAEVVVVGGGGGDEVEADVLRARRVLEGGENGSH